LKIIIIGSGIFGVTSALELRARGWDVTLIDAGEVPEPTAASTDISKVVRADYGDDLLYVEMAEAAMRGWDDWNARWPAPLYHEDGFLLLSSGEMRPGSFEYDSWTLLARRGHPVERLDGRARGVRFPAWSPERYPDGYLNRRAGWAESGNVVRTLVRDARAAGITLVERTRIERFIERGSRIEGVSTSGQREFRADIVLVAAGAWTPALLPHLSNVMWTTGQPVVHIRVDDPVRWQPPHFPVWAADIARTGWYGFPALPDGTLKIGHHAVGRRVDPHGPRTILPSEAALVREFLAASLPPLAGAPIVASRVCLYCDTFDGNFWIDHDPDRPGLVVAAGDSGHGFKFAPIFGSIVADVVERKPNAWADRFARRARIRDSKEAARAL
jgi:glycine/D-amino acid oxidase-like deaminating enzyme